jgi:hypothetical protein
VVVISDVRSDHFASPDTSAVPGYESVDQELCFHEEHEHDSNEVGLDMDEERGQTSPLPELPIDVICSMKYQVVTTASSSCLTSLMLSLSLSVSVYLCLMSIHR